MNLLYDAGIGLYRLGVRIAARNGNRKARQLNDGLNGVWQLLESKVGRHDRNIWFHAASLGEFEQGRPLIERLKTNHPDIRIVLTFFSPSGYEVRKNYAGADVIAYLPLDTLRNARRFLNIVNPEKAFFIKYEFWLNYLNELRSREIPTYLISGIFRRDQLFFKPYGGIYRKCLNAFRTLYVQDNGSRKLLENIGIRNTVVAGDTRFDRVTDIMQTVKPNPILDIFCGYSESRRGKRIGERPLIFMAGSSWPEDESVYSRWLVDTDLVKGVIAPHEFDDERLKNLLILFDGEAVLMSDAMRDPSLLEEKKILIIDCFGLLASAYSYADVAYVGGGFGSGLHNINEAAVYAIPVIYGPNHSKFIEAEEMKTLGGGIAVNSRNSFERAANRLLHDERERMKRGRWAGEYIASKIGASDKIYNDLFKQ